MEASFMLRKIVVAGAFALASAGSAASQTYGTLNANVLGFNPASVGTPLAVSSANSTAPLPAGVTVVATNVGASQGAFCALGASSSTAQQYIAPNGGWFAFSVGAATQISCVTASGTTTINLVGGTGFPTGGGGSLSGIAAAVGATGSSAPTSAALEGAVSGGNLAPLIQANASVPISISTAATTQLVAASGSARIYVTAWDVVAGGVGTIKLEYGSGSNCATGATALTGAYTLTAYSGNAIGTGLAPVFVVPAGAALCAVTSAAAPMNGSVTYTQF
jgi:hypothetical protein